MLQIGAGAHNVWWERQERAALWRGAQFCGLGSVPLALPALTLPAFPQPRAGRTLQRAACCQCWGKQQQHVQPRNR